MLLFVVDIHGQGNRQGVDLVSGRLHGVVCQTRSHDLDLLLLSIIPCAFFALAFALCLRENVLIEEAIRIVKRRLPPDFDCWHSCVSFLLSSATGPVVYGNITLKVNGVYGAWSSLAA